MQPGLLLAKEEVTTTGDLLLFVQLGPDQVPIRSGSIGTWFDGFPNGFDVEPDH